MLNELVILVAIIVVTLALVLVLLVLAQFRYLSNANRLEEGGSGPVEEGDLSLRKVEIVKQPEERSRQGAQTVVENSSQVHPDPLCFTLDQVREFSLDQVREFTDDFSAEKQLGEGGFGPVYRGVIATTNVEVAVKRLRAGSGQGRPEFLTEVKMISRVHNKHLVSLVGFCTAESECILVYEFVPRGSLESLLHDGQLSLDWSTRLKIALGSAKGLAYLHEHCNPRIIHRDIKASNILVGLKFEAKIADFGLAKCISESKTHATTLGKGTVGYVDPVYFKSGELTEKSDVYSFGVVLLELITGRKPVFPKDGTEAGNENLVAWATPLLKQALEDGNFNSLVDCRRQDNYEDNEMARMVACAAACVCESPEHRPKMSRVVQALEGDLPLCAPNDGIISRLNILKLFLTRV